MLVQELKLTSPIKSTEKDPAALMRYQAKMHNLNLIKRKHQSKPMEGHST